MPADFWERAANADPLWAILSDPSKRGRRWSVDEFFETGRREISLLAEHRQRENVGPRPEAMSDDAYSAELRLQTPWCERASTASKLDLLVTVRNASHVDWRQSARDSIRVGNHWLDTNGAMLIQDDARVELPRTVTSGTEVTIPITVQTPPRPGAYICELDVVHEGITWFGDRGSKTLRRHLLVGEIPRDSFGDADRVTADLSAESTREFYSHLPPEVHAVEDFPMDGIPKATVLSILSSAGADCFHISPDERGGPEWIGYRYFVRKPA